MITSKCDSGAFHRKTLQKRFSRLTFLCLLIGASCANPPDVSYQSLHEPSLARHVLNSEPIRGETKQLLFTVDDMSGPCSTCHDDFSGDLQQEALEDMHANIDFDHGMNSRCLNCHNANNPDTFINHDGSEIPSDQPSDLCWKCHGPQHRDWVIGIHGRTNGHWAPQFGEQHKLDCIQCHDPHKPHFPMMAPDPSPVLTRFEDKFVSNSTGEIHVLLESGSEPEADEDSGEGDKASEESGMEEHEVTDDEG